MSTKTQAILVVSFGTSHADTRAVTIDAIEADIAAAFPDAAVYRAWTSKMIIKKLKTRDGITIPTVSEAMEQLTADGIRQVIVQPTHVINGIENDRMKEDVLAFRDRFDEIRFGDPLLSSERDNQEIIRIIAESFSDLEKDEALVLMGHGTTHYANTIYAALDYTFKDSGCSRIYVGTVEAYPSFDSLLRQLKENHYRTLVLAPFMIVAGDHAKNDMAGDDPDSWRYRFEQNGFSTRCVLKGLGEYPDVRRLLITHITESK